MVFPMMWPGMAPPPRQQPAQQNQQPPSQQNQQPPSQQNQQQPAQQNQQQPTQQNQQREEQGTVLDACVDVWVYACVGVWVCGCVGVCMCGCLGVCVCGCVGVCVCRCVTFMAYIIFLSQILLGMLKPHPLSQMGVWHHPLLKPSLLRVLLDPEDGVKGQIYHHSHHSWSHLPSWVHHSALCRHLVCVCVCVPTYST